MEDPNQNENPNVEQNPDENVEQNQNVGQNSNGNVEPNQNVEQNQNVNPDNKIVGTVGKITGGLIGNYIVYSFIAGIIYMKVLSKFLQKAFENNMTLLAIIAVAISTLIAIGVWKISVSSVFKKVNIAKADVSKVMVRLVIFVVILCLLSGAYNYWNFKTTIGDTKKTQIERFETLTKSYSNTIDLQKYREQLEEEMNKAVKPYAKTLIITQVGESIAHLAVLFLVKKDIKKHIVEEGR